MLPVDRSISQKVIVRLRQRERSDWRLTRTRERSGRGLYDTTILKTKARRAILQSLVKELDDPHSISFLKRHDFTPEQHLYPDNFVVQYRDAENQAAHICSTRLKGSLEVTEKSSLVQTTAEKCTSLFQQIQIHEFQATTGQAM